MRKTYLFAIAPVFFAMFLAMTFCGLPEDYRADCPICHGAMDCTYCHGTGKIMDNSTGQMINCYSCHGSGDCKYCGGDGKIDAGEGGDSK